MAKQPELDLYLAVLRVLEQANVPYVIIGAFAGASYGVMRATFDVDIVVDLNEQHIGSLADAFPSPRYYADPEQMRSSIRLGILFNIIDATEGRKVDLIPLTMKPGYGWALERRIRRRFATSNSEVFEAWCARPEDVIVGKLMAWKEGHSTKHEWDIRDILAAVRLGEDPDLTGFDYGYVGDWAGRLGPDVEYEWRDLYEYQT
jgi:hypothetical protein